MRRFAALLLSVGLLASAAAYGQGKENFGALQSGTNLEMAAICGTGCSIATSGTGTIEATGLASVLGSGAIGFGAAALTADGVNCAVAADVVAGPWGAQPTIICTDNDASIITGTYTGGAWDSGSLTFALQYIQTASDTAALNADVSARCIGPGELPSALNDAQDETSYDNSPTSEGTFVAGSSYSAADAITMSDGTIVTVDTLSGSAVLEFTIDSSASTGAVAGANLTQSSVAPAGGSGFQLTPDTDNVTTYGTEVAIDDAGVTGSGALDTTTSAAVTPSGPGGCASGDVIQWQVAIDATGTTTAMATLHFIGERLGW